VLMRAYLASRPGLPDLPPGAGQRYPARASTMTARQHRNARAGTGSAVMDGNLDGQQLLRVVIGHLG